MSTGLPLYKLNWDNDFNIRFHLAEHSLQHIPNNIFGLEMGDMSVQEMAEDTINYQLKLTLRSTVDGSVENEIFTTLMKTPFDMDLSLSNPNRMTWKFRACELDKVSFSPLIDRKSRSNPFNYILTIKVGQVIFQVDDQVMTFGTISPVDEVWVRPSEIKE